VCSSDLLHCAAQLSRHPIVAIGGVNENNVKNILKAGAHGIAAIGVFHNALHPKITTQNLSDILGISLC